MEWNIFTMKVVLVSSCVVSMGLAMRVSVPLALEFMASHVPLVWSSVVPWLRPPYLYVVVNAIIISIAASSRFHHHHQHHRHDDQKSSQDYDHHDHDHDRVVSSEFRTMENDPMVVMYQRREEVESADVDDNDDDQVKSVVAVNSPEEVKDIDSRDDDQEELLMVLRSGEEKKIVLSPEKPLVSPRFDKRKLVKPTTDGGKALKVTSKPKRQHETLENTWKAIMEGRSTSFSRQVNKWDYNLENQGRQIIGFRDLAVDQAPSPPTMKKSETFKDRTNQEVPAASTTCGNLRKEPSLSEDELNKRVEAFIKKFNEQMRLQRQESLNKYMEMINRGSH